MRKNRYKINRDFLGKCSIKPKSDFGSIDTENKFISREKDCLLPFFRLENGKEVFLKHLEILRSDISTDYTILKAKPGDFKTSKQLEKDGSLYSPFEGKEFDVITYRTGTDNYDLFGINYYQYLYSELNFLLIFEFYKENYDKLKFNYLKG